MWNLEQLSDLITTNTDYVVTKEDNCLVIANSDGLDAWLAISGEQILVESILFSTDEVTDQIALNNEILRTHQMFPLTTVAITAISNNEYYVAFGSLSAQSKESSVLIEIETLYQNVSGFLDAYQNFLTQ